MTTKNTAEAADGRAAKDRPKTFAALRRTFVEHHANPGQAIAEAIAYEGDEKKRPGCHCKPCGEYLARAEKEEDQLL